MGRVGRYLIGLHSAYYTDRLITHPLSTATHFIRTNFAFHVLSVVPFEILVFLLRNPFTCEYQQTWNWVTGSPGQWKCDPVPRLHGECLARAKHAGVMHDTTGALKTQVLENASTK